MIADSKSRADFGRMERAAFETDRRNRDCLTVGSDCELGSGGNVRDKLIVYEIPGGHACGIFLFGANESQFQDRGRDHAQAVISYGWH